MAGLGVVTPVLVEKMTVKQFQKEIRTAGFREVQDWLLLVDALQDAKDRRRAGVLVKLPGPISRVGWRDRDVRRGSALAALSRSHHLFLCQLEEARGLLLGYAGQIWKHRGKIPVRTSEIRFDESARCWKSTFP